MKITIRRFILLLTGVLTFLSADLFAQDGLPAIIQHNGTVNSGNCWVVDPDSLRGHYTFVNTTLTINSPAGTRFGIFLDSLVLGSDYDTIRIYDGNTVNAPLLTYITSYNFSTNPPRSVKTSGNAVTIYFHPDPYLANTNAAWRLGLRTFTDIGSQITGFLPAFQLTPANGFIDLADSDNDGDMDILSEGIVCENLAGEDSVYLFDRLRNIIGNWSASRMTSADFNNDGLKDVFITGLSNLAGGSYIPTTALFRNNGNNSFTRITGITGLVPVAYGACSVTDLNNDGKPDITYTGSLSGQMTDCVFRVFINNGNFNFTEQATNLPGLMDSNMDWKDYDNDGDPDLLMNGYNNQGSVTGIFKNNGNGNFTSLTLPPFYQTSSGMVRWVDLNNDGKIDILNTGVTTPGSASGVTPEFLVNIGNDNFTRMISNLPGRALSNLDLADYDNDGDPDLVYSGLLPNSPETDVAVYRNDGNGSFTRKIYYAGQQCLNTVKWIDLNGDHRKDLFVCGRSNLYASQVYLNISADSFRLASYPFTGYALGGYLSSVLAEDLNNDGLTDFLFAGELDDQDCAEGRGSTLIYSEGWKRKPFMAFKKVYDYWSTGGPAIPARSFWRWGDVNNDGRPDILSTIAWEPLKIFKNEGNNHFSLMYSGYPNPSRNNEIVQVIDIDNDGSNELWVAPNKLYKWNGSGFTTLYETTGIGCEGGVTTDCQGYAEAGDYNKDGYVDMAFVQGVFVYILRNDKQGHLVNDYPAYLTTIGASGTLHQVNWVDYDSDGDLDLITRDKILENTSWGGFRYRGDNLQDYGSLAHGDFNQDGWKDIVCLNRTPPAFGPAHLYYNLQGTGYFEEITPADFIQSYGGSYYTGIRAADLDNDGDEDIVYGTGAGCSFSGVYINRYSEIYPNLHLLKPNGGEVFSNGTTVPIRWTGQQLSNTVKIELSLNNGASYSVIQAAAAGNSSGGLFNWVIGATPSTKCKIRITDNASGQLADSSNKVFSITLSTGLPNVVRVNELKVYPNPAKDRIYCLAKGIPAGRSIQCTIYDARGQRVRQADQQTDATGMVALETGSLSNGIYFIQLKYKQQVFGKQLVVLH